MSLLWLYLVSPSARYCSLLLMVFKGFPRDVWDPEIGPYHPVSNLNSDLSHALSVFVQGIMLQPSIVFSPRLISWYTLRRYWVVCCEERVPRCHLKQATGQWRRTSDHNVKIFIFSILNIRLYFINGINVRSSNHFCIYLFPKFRTNFGKSWERA